MSYPEKFYDLLFEVSNEYRHSLMLELRKQPNRITELSKKKEMTSQEVSRHLNRLSEINLICKDVDGYFSLTSLGETVLVLLEEIVFASNYSDYLVEHEINHLDPIFLKTIGTLSDSKLHENMLDFLHLIENIVNDSELHVWLIVNNFPMILLDTFIKAINRGVEVRLLIEKTSGPIVNFGSLTDPLKRIRDTPHVEERITSKPPVFLVLSEKKAAVAFPSLSGSFDFTGLETLDIMANTWCTNLFDLIWSKSSPRKKVISKIAEDMGLERDEKKTVTILGKNDASVDPYLVQNAVDHYDEVILDGVFNFGSNSVKISRSCLVRGKGRENNIPVTKVFKQNWIFPFRFYDQVFKIRGEGIDVTIENLFFTDFNCIGIYAENGNSLLVKNNRFTLEDGLARGMTYPPYGDLLIGIFCSSMAGSDDPDYTDKFTYAFPGGIKITGNYLDFATNYIRGGYISRGGKETDPSYRPELMDHQKVLAHGIIVNFSDGQVKIDQNVIRNMNTRGIFVFGNSRNAKVSITDNLMESEVYGTYGYYGDDAGVGICVQTAWSFPSPSYPIEIISNTVRLEKINFSGICLLGPVMSHGDSDVFRDGLIRDNEIELSSGYTGIHLRKAVGFEIEDNNVSGHAYYGIKVSGRRKTDEMDARSFDNRIIDNDLSRLIIKTPDEYTYKKTNGKTFSLITDKPVTAHYWFDTNTLKNTLVKSEKDSLIDEGKDNSIIEK